MRRKPFHVGFTGTREGLTSWQYEVVEEFVGEFEWFHHGDCIGADEEAFTIARSFGLKIWQHPPIKDDLRAFTSYFDESCAPDEYLSRNNCIVDRVGFLIATPKELKEVLRSGTWATIRYAKDCSMNGIIVYPDGNVERLK